MRAIPFILLLTVVRNCITIADDQVGEALTAPVDLKNRVQQVGINRAQQVSSEDAPVTGTTYNFDVTVKCFCGGGEGLYPDLYLKIYECQGGDRFHRKVKSSEVVTKNDHHTSHFPHAFKWKFDPTVKTMVSIQINDADTFYHDELGYTHCFDPFDSPPGGRRNFEQYTRSFADCRKLQLDKDMEVTCNGNKPEEVIVKKAGKA